MRAGGTAGRAGARAWSRSRSTCAQPDRAAGRDEVHSSARDDRAPLPGSSVEAAHRGVEGRAAQWQRMSERQEEISRRQIRERARFECWQREVGLGRGARGPGVRGSLQKKSRSVRDAHISSKVCASRTHLDFLTEEPPGCGGRRGGRNRPQRLRPERRRSTLTRPSLARAVGRVPVRRAPRGPLLAVSPCRAVPPAGSIPS